MSFFDDISGGGFINSALSFAGDKHLQNDNQSFQREMAKNKYQYAAGDLAKAGLNPIMAIKGLQGGTGGASSSQSNSAPSVLQSKLLLKQIEKTESEKKLIDNKKDSTDPMAVIGELLGKFLDSNAKEAGNPVDKLIDATQNVASPKHKKPTPEVREHMIKNRHKTLPGVDNKKRKLFKFDKR